MTFNLHILRNSIKCSRYSSFLQQIFIGRASNVDIKLENNNVCLAYSSYVGNVPNRVDVVVIGGGIMGTSTAYWMKQRPTEPLHILVVEKDLQYKYASTVLSVGGVRQQFSLPENIQMSRFGAEFLKNIRRHLKSDVDVNFKTCGYLTLADESGAPILEKNNKIQRENNVKNVLLTAKQINEKFPWVNTLGIHLACLGLENEGWCDPWALLSGLKHKALELGVEYLQGEVVNFTFTNTPASSNCEIRRIIVKTANGALEDIEFNVCVLAAGPSSGAVAKLARIGFGEGLLSVPLPVEPRKRFVYCFDCQADNAPGIDSPMLIDSSGVWARREGSTKCFIAGKSPSPDGEPQVKDFELDYDYFDSEIWPILAHRVPAFEALKVRGGWAGHYEVNTFDENGIIGQHPYYKNLFIASGFSGHGFQQGIAVGRAISEIILDGKFTSLNLERFGFDRLISNKPLFEAHIV